VPRRILVWEDCLNARELGGYPTAAGRRIRWGALVRADSLGRLTPRGCEAVLAHGVRTVIDLRFPDEVAREPNPFCDGSAVRYLNIPVSAGRDRALDHELSVRLGTAGTREEANILELDANRPGFALIASAVAQAPPGGVVVHCGSGKDRSGIAVALLLQVAGVPDDVVAEDYGLSAARLRESYERQLAAWPIDDRERFREQLSSRPGTMLTTLAHLRERHGGAEAYLLAGGTTPAEIVRLRERLVE
jgi:protein tyrosine/serine phosphatase